MPFLFESFPKINYDIKKNGKQEIVTDITVRFKLIQAIKSRQAVYYDYTIQEGERPDIVAFKYYGDSTLDWIILMVNNIIDPVYDWPMAHKSFEKYLKNKYGSLSVAHSTNHEYRKVLNQQSTLFDGTFVSKRTLVVDETTYNSLNVSMREAISKYQYEEELNESKRQIKLIDSDYVSDIINQYESVFE